VPSTTATSLAPLIRKLETELVLTPEEREAVSALPVRPASLRADQDVVREGDKPTRSFVLLSGYACSYKVTGDGRRQVLSLHVPGEMPDLQSLHLRTMDISLGTLTRCEGAFVEHADLRALCHARPRIADALWRETLIVAAIVREWLLNVSRREGAARMAHLLCEWFLRLKAVGLVDGDACDMPATQVQLGEATGFSAVHTNRVLQELRAAGLIALHAGRLEVLDWDGLATFGDFDPTYLHMNPAESLR
jgi:CRP-like cAMP-binding protein